MMAASSPHALVTGGAGFLGSHLCERLLADGSRVTAIDNLYTGTRHNIEALLDQPRFTFLQHDVSVPLPIDAVVTQIFNLACPASPVHYQRKPLQTIKTSVLGTLQMLELAQRQRARLFQASTSEVYGDPLIHPQTEDYWGHVNPIGIRACYDESKRCAETLCFEFHRGVGLPIRVGRIFNTYGPRMHPDDGRVVSNFIVQALRNQPLTIYGDGTQTRSFCYVTDLINAIVCFMRAEEITGPLNLGNPQEYTVEELARVVLDLTGSRSPLVRKPIPQDDPKQRCPDLTRTRAALHWEPTTPLKVGLQHTIRYFESRLAAV